MQLHGKRSSGFGPGALTNTEILSWATLFRIEITPTEVYLLHALDGEFLKIQALKNERESTQPTLQDTLEDIVFLEEAKLAIAKREAAKKNG